MPIDVETLVAKGTEPNTADRTTRKTAVLEYLEGNVELMERFFAARGGYERGRLRRGGVARRGPGQTQVFEVAGEGRLGHREASPAEELLELLLRAHGLVLDQLEDLGPPSPGTSDRICIHVVA